MSFLPALIGGAASLGGALIGAGAMGSAQGQARDLIEQSIRDLQAIGVPPMEAMEITLEKYRSEGQLTPELEQVIRQGSSEMEGISLDPRSKEAQIQALLELQDIGNEGGMRLSDKAKMNQMMGEIQSAEKGSRDRIEQEMREKNQFGGGAELAMKLANQQNAAQAANQMGLGLNAQAQDRAFQAILEAGKLGGNINAQDFDQQARVKAAQDEINRFNAQNSQEVAMRNAAAQNQARQYNLGNMQNISNANVDLSNQQQIANKGLYQTNFNNQMTKAQSMANARAGQASNVLDAGKSQAQLWGGVGQGLGQIGTSISQSMFNPEKKKKEEA